MDLTEKELELQLKQCEPESLDAALLDKLEFSMENCQDPRELRSLEADLALLDPSELSEDQLESLESAMDLSKIESYLEGFSANDMTGDILQRMEAAMDNWQSPETDNTIDFPEREVKKTASFGMVWSSVAAVAILLGAGYLISQDTNQEIPVVSDTSMKPKQEQVPFTVSEPNSMSQLSSNIKNASYEGTVGSKSAGHKVLKVQCEDVVDFIDEKGRRCQMKKPSYKYILIPVEVN